MGSGVGFKHRALTEPSVCLKSWGEEATDSGRAQHSRNCCGSPLWVSIALEATEWSVSRAVFPR